MGISITVVTSAIHLQRADAIQIGVSSRKVMALGQTRRGDWVMRMRFWEQNTRETENFVWQAVAGARLCPQSPVAWPNHRA